jgi:NADPH:quinone reductase-like Zn-dependent oxidoreductase
MTPSSTLQAGMAIGSAVAERSLTKPAPHDRPVTTGLMRAFVYDRYGGPEQLRLEYVAKPIPGPAEVRVRVEASSLNSADLRILRANPFLVRLAYGLFRPSLRILGADVVGVVDAVGANVTGFSVGQQVWGDASMHRMGAFAQFVCLPAQALAALPPTLDPREAASLPLAATTAIQAARNRITHGQRVLICGAGGGVGGALIQVAKAAGAQVTAICGARSVISSRQLGADEVVDRDTSLALGADFDVVFGVNGYRPFGDFMRCLRPGGLYVMVGGENRQIFSALLGGALRARLAGRRAVALTMDSALTQLDFAEMAHMVQRRQLVPTVDQMLPMHQLPDAFARFESGAVSRKLVLDASAFHA